MSIRSDQQQLAKATNEILDRKFCASCHKYVPPTPKGVIRKRRSGHTRWICEHCAQKMRLREEEIKKIRQTKTESS